MAFSKLPVGHRHDGLAARSQHPLDLVEHFQGLVEVVNLQQREIQQHALQERRHEHTSDLRAEGFVQMAGGAHITRTTTQPHVRPTSRGARSDG